jgi:hypothetical protein
VLSIVSLDCAVNRFFRCLPVVDRIESRRLARSSGPAPVNHIAVIAAVSVQRQLVVCEEPPALRVGRHEAQPLFQDERSRCLRLTDGKTPWVLRIA